MGQALKLERSLNKATPPPIGPFTSKVLTSSHFISVKPAEQLRPPHSTGLLQPWILVCRSSAGTMI